MNLKICKSCLTTYSSNRDRKAFPATFVTSDRGTKRSASTVNQLVQPEITTVFCRARPRNAVSTTSSGGLNSAHRRSIDLRRFEKVCFCHTRTKRHHMNSMQPVLFRSASENDNTNAFVAAYVAM